jgi:DNA-directed RNA polymerase II subunit RPB2
MDASVLQMDPWCAINSYFKGSHLQRLVQHQIESYNEFTMHQIQQTIEQFNPVVIHSDQNYNKELKKYSLEIMIRFTNFQISRPQIHENNGSTKVMFPHEARLRNFTYAATTTVDINIQYIVRSGPELEEIQCYNNVLKQIHIGKLPIMLKSSACVLTQYAHLGHEMTGECRYDPGGYFIINGSEKTVLGQERTAENKIYCFPASSHKYLLQAEMKCSPDSKRISPKQVNLYLSKQNGEHVIHVNIPRIRKHIPIGIVFRAMNILTDKEMCRYMTMDAMDKEFAEMIRGSIIEASTCLTQEDALTYIAVHAMYTPIHSDKPSQRKQEFVVDVLRDDLFSQCKTREQQVHLLGYMANKLLLCALNRRPFDDRDSYLNKRISLTGSLLNDLYRNYFNKLVKDMQKQVIREINTGSWKSKEDYSQIITTTNVYKIVKSTTIENGLKRALSTGDFGTKQTIAKVGVAQVLNRLTYAASLSHLRRVNNPSGQSGKLVAPRKLSATTWGFLCPAETPEGQSVGVVKNMSYMTHITVRSECSSLYKHVEPFLTPLSLDIVHTKVFVNGAWIGCSDNPQELFLSMKAKKSASIINVYTSVVFDYKYNEIHICNDSGRLVRPVFKVKDGKLLYTQEMTQKLKQGKLTWDELVAGESVIEYIDPCEQNASFISMSTTLDNTRYTHCELNPSTIFGVLASCIPFPDHNQSPRNTYQCAMGKQAIGVYVTNYDARMDKTAWILNYPHRPLVDTRIMHMLKLHELPSGTPIIVAIMTHTGYNQEDSVMFNQGALDRGLFRTTAFETKKDEDKKTHGEDEVRCKPDEQRTKGMKFSNYSKIGEDGLMPKNTLIESMDIIMGKVSPIKSARNDPTAKIKFEDASKYHRTDEVCYMDKNYVGVNGDGYTTWKGRIRADRSPQIGDKFSSRHGQKGTVGNIIPEVDMPFTADGLKPDIIINPHAIPSRMTIGQLKETLMGKVLLELGMFGDGTAFTEMSVDTIARELLKVGYESNGNEILYNALSGEQMETSTFIGPAFYQRLKHMVGDKHHSRAKGPMVNLTRQPAEGRSRDGGLRFGEMERDCMVSHGAAAFTKGRMYDDSDAFVVHVCKKCGVIASHNDANHVHLCKLCDNRTGFHKLNMPYACKLLFHELITMNVVPRMITRD